MNPAKTSRRAIRLNLAKTSGPWKYTLNIRLWVKSLSFGSWFVKQQKLYTLLFYYNNLLTVSHLPVVRGVWGDQETVLGGWKGNVQGPLGKEVSRRPRETSRGDWNGPVVSPYCSQEDLRLGDVTSLGNNLQCPSLHQVKCNLSSLPWLMRPTGIWSLMIFWWAHFFSFYLIHYVSATCHLLCLKHANFFVTWGYCTCCSLCLYYTPSDFPCMAYFHPLVFRSNAPLVISSVPTWS